MWLLAGEALLALGLLVFIVWWTMFSSKKPGHDVDQVHTKDDSKQD
ncbi:MAG: hypothetical protein JWP36_1281 [Paucimonas sp.]|nr:hypothetical protein [Paucimonas sp.]